MKISKVCIRGINELIVLFSFYKNLSELVEYSTTLCPIEGLQASVLFLLYVFKKIIHGISYCHFKIFFNSDLSHFYHNTQTANLIHNPFKLIYLNEPANLSALFFSFN